MYVTQICNMCVNDKTYGSSACSIINFFLHVQFPLSREISGDFKLICDVCLLTCTGMSLNSQINKTETNMLACIVNVPV